MNYSTGQKRAVANLKDNQRPLGVWDKACGDIKQVMKVEHELLRMSGVCLFIKIMKKSPRLPDPDSQELHAGARVISLPVSEQNL